MVIRPKLNEDLTIYADHTGGNGSEPKQNLFSNAKLRTSISKLHANVWSQFIEKKHQNDNMVTQHGKRDAEVTGGLRKEFYMSTRSKSKNHLPHDQFENVDEKGLSALEILPIQSILIQKQWIFTNKTRSKSTAEKNTLHEKLQYLKKKLELVTKTTSVSEIL